MFENKFIKSFKPYKVVKNSSKKLDTLKLDWNEPTIQPSKKIFFAVKEYLNKEKLNIYPDLKNNELLKALSSYARVSKKHIQYFAGSDALQECIAKTFLGEKDKVVLVSPTYDNFRSTAEATGAKALFFKLDNNKVFNIEKFIKFTSHQKPKAIYICNPNNPTGTIFENSQLKILFKKFSNTLFIIDEAYYEFYGKSVSQYVKNYNNLIVCRSFSKAFCLASFRLGYAIASEDLIISLNKVRNPKSVPSLSQVAGLAALSDIEYTEKFVREVLKSKFKFLKEIKKIGSSEIQVYEGSGNFVLLKIMNKKVDALISRLERESIFIRNLSHVPGLDNHVRVTIGKPNEMRKVIQIITTFFKDKIN